jgi:CheY-like chemotaxis protein
MLLKGKTIFIVEDNPGNLAVATIYLKQQGASIYFSRRGNDAVDRITNALPVDIILMDLMLPKYQSGFDLFSELRANPKLKDIPVIAVSAADADIAIPRALEMGFSGYIAKPISPRIATQIAEVIAGKQVWDGEQIY